MLNQHDPSRTALCRPHGRCPMLKRLPFGSPSRGHQVAVSSMFGVPSVLLCPTENSVVSPAVFVLFILLSRFAEHDKPASLNSSPRRVPGNRTRDTPAARGDGICGWS